MSRKMNRTHRPVSQSNSAPKSVSQSHPVQKKNNWVLTIVDTILLIVLVLFLVRIIGDLFVADDEMKKIVQDWVSPISAAVTGIVAAIVNVVLGNKDAKAMPTIYGSIALTAVLFVSNLVAGGAHTYVSSPCFGVTPADVSKHEVMVLFAKFVQGNNAKDVPSEQWIVTLPNQMRDEVEKQNLKFVELKQTITSPDQAKTISACYNATMVIWGEVADGVITAQYTGRWEKADLFGTTYVISEDDRVIKSFIRNGGDTEYILNDLLGRLTPRPKDSIPFLTKAIALVPHGRESEMGYQDLLATTAWTYFNDRQTNTAMDYINRALKFDPKNSDSYVIRGIFYRQQNMIDLAHTDFDTAVSLDSKNAAAYNNRSQLLVDIGQYKAALSDTDNALLYDAKDQDSNLIERGVINVLMGYTNDALADLTHAITINPKNSDAFANRAGIYLLLGKTSNAQSDINTALGLDPNNITALATQANLCLTEGQCSAIDYANKIISVNPNVSDAFSVRGYAFYLSGSYAAALNDLNHAVNLNTKNTENYYRRALINHKLGNMKDALSDLETYANMTGSQDSSVLSKIANLKSVLGVK